jgi:hypothetical protein
MSINDIVANIDHRLAELDAELTQLSGAREALINGARPPAARTLPASRPHRRAPRASAKRSYEVVPAGKIIAQLSGREGTTTRELAQATNGDPARLLSLLKEQEDAGQVRRSGTRAATRWHVITDEDRIAARAAELRAAGRHTRARRT